MQRRIRHLVNVPEDQLPFTAGVAGVHAEANVLSVQQPFENLKLLRLVFCDIQLPMPSRYPSLFLYAPSTFANVFATEGFSAITSIFPVICFNPPFPFCCYVHFQIDELPQNYY